MLQGIEGVVYRFGYAVALLLQRYPDYATGIVHFRSLVVGLPHPLIASEPWRLAKPARNANFSLEVKRNAATASAPDMRSLVALAH